MRIWPACALTATVSIATAGYSAYIERRLSEEQAAMAALSNETFPFTLPPDRLAAASPEEGRNV